MAALGLVVACGGEMEREGLPESTLRVTDTAVVRGAVTGDNLGGVNLGGVNLGAPNLGGVNIAGPNLGGVNLGATNLGAVNLGGTNLGGPNLGGVNLGATNLGAVNLGGVNLGGVNLGAVNLGATNLGAVNLGAPNLGAVNLGATNLGAVNLGAPNAGINIHGQTANGLLYSGEDKWTNAASRCVVMGIGSSAFARLVAQNPGTRMSAAIKQLPWGFAETSGGPVTHNAWEALVWGSNTYCTFLLMVPPGATHAGVAGFIKAVFRWTAPPSKSIDIGAIGGGQPIQTHAGMMDAGAKFLSGLITQKAFVAGEFAFISATTNNQTVNVDFASWVRKADNAGLILGNVSGNPLYADAVFRAVERASGAVEIQVAAIGSPGVPGSAELVMARARLAQSGRATMPQPKRCAGALMAGYYGDTASAAAKCDPYLSLDMSSSGWDGNWAAAGGTVLPYNAYMMRMESNVAKASPSFVLSKCVAECNTENDPIYELTQVISETYVHMNEEAYSNREYLDRATSMGMACRDINGSPDNTGGYGREAICARLESGSDGAIYRYDSNRPSGSEWQQLGTLRGARVASGTELWMATSAGTTYRWYPFNSTWIKVSQTCQDIAATSASVGRAFCVGLGKPDGTVYSYSGGTFSKLGSMSGMRVTADNEGVPYVAKSNGDVYRYVNNTWSLFARGCTKDIAISGGVLVCLDSGSNVLRWNRVTSAWQSTGRTATSLGSGFATEFWFTDLSGRPWNWL